MTSRPWAALVFVAGLALPCPSAAEPARFDDDGLASEAPFDLGATRGLCIGTEIECLAGGAAPGGFDLRVSFAIDSAILTDDAKRHLAGFAAALKANRLAHARFVVEGHSDASGSASHNLDLSERRARSVRQYLLDQGVSPDKLLATGLGETEPRSDDPFDPVNRRVEMKIEIR